MERHLADTLAICVRAARRKDANGERDIEADLRTGIGRLTGRVEEIMAQQSARDADRLHEHSEFIKQRHPDDRDLPNET